MHLCVLVNLFGNTPSTSDFSPSLSQSQYSLLQCCRPSSVPTKDEDATTSIDGIESTISELKALRLSPAAVFALFKNQSEGGNRVLHVADKKNLLSNIWLASFDVWKLIVMYF